MDIHIHAAGSVSRGKAGDSNGLNIMILLQSPKETLKKEFTHSNPYAHACRHPKRSAYTKPMLRMGESANSEMHSMLNSCCTWAPPSTDDSTGLGCVDSCHHS